jgi:SAM-dependent methyltransferase
MTALCRLCGASLHETFVDLGMAPPCESYVNVEDANRMEAFYPLHALVCDRCFLVQLEEYVSPSDIFSEYAYFSSYSDSWLDHARRYTDMIVDRLQLGPQSTVMELASNDGYLLQYFVQKQIKAIGVDPAANVAAAAHARGVTTIVKFFGRETARELANQYGLTDLLIGNNVLAQVPDLHDFVDGMRLLLKPDGVITMEFPHLLRLIQDNQFDTIYHEHFSYFSFMAVERLFAQHGLVLFDVEALTTHGGSLRIYGQLNDAQMRPTNDRVFAMRQSERAAGLDRIETYGTFAEQVRETKRTLLEFLIGVRRAGKTVVGYGAPGKGNTLLNYCGIRTDFIDYTVDRNPYKQGKLLPGTHVPIRHPDAIEQTKPDYLLILPWNLKDEIMEQMAGIRAWGGQFVVPIPHVSVLS